MDPQTPQEQPTPPPTPAVEAPPAAPEAVPAPIEQPVPPAPPVNQYPPQPQQPTAVAPTAQAKTNIFAILALVFAFLFPIVGLVFGLVASSQIKKTGEQGKGLAMAGTIISIVFIVIAVVVYVLGLMSANKATTPGY